jgi:hypothetical protein
MTSGEQDFTKRMKGMMDLYWVKGVELQDPTVAGCIPVSIEHIVRISHEQILGIALKTPTFAQCVPTSIENDAIAYDASNDRFKVDIEAMSVGTISAAITSDWTRQLGLVDLSRVLGAALSHSNPVIARLTDGSAFIDPRDVSDRAARLLGVVYGSLDKLQQQATTKELLVQISHEGVIKDPTQIRALTATDIITVVQSAAASLLATVTQASSVRTISSIDAVATAVQISNTFAGAGNYTVHTPAGGKKVRLKFLSLELSADADLGYRFGAAGTIFYLRTTAGVYLSNLMGCNNEGAADEALILNASGACVVKGYVLIEEI